MTTALSQRERNRLARRATIVRAARQTFLDHGYAATSMSTIAAALGGSKATLWKHFPSKEDLFAAVLDDLIENHRAELENILQPGRDVRATLLAFANKFLDRVSTPDKIMLTRLVAGESGRFPEVGKMFFERGPFPIMRKLANYFGQCIAAGTLRDANPMIMVDQFICMVQGTAYQKRLWNVIDDQWIASRDENTVAAIDTFIRAYAVKP